VAALERQLADATLRREARALFRGVVASIEIRPDGATARGVAINVQGRIESLLALAAEGTANGRGPNRSNRTVKWRATTNEDEHYVYAIAL
jgi:hypothetical protein